MAATYDGVACFGVAVTTTPQDTDPAIQQTSYPGVSGVETTFLGTRGTHIVVRGMLVGSTGADLATAEGVLRSYRDGIPRTLVDTTGNSWAYAILTKLDLDQSPIINMGGGRGYARRFTAVFQTPY